MKRVLLVVLAACASGPRPVPHDASNAQRAAKWIKAYLSHPLNARYLAKMFADAATYDGFAFGDGACAARFGDRGTIDAANANAFVACIYALPGVKSITWLPTADGDPLVAPTTPPTIQVWGAPPMERHDGVILRLAMRGTPTEPVTPPSAATPPVPPDDDVHNGAPEEEIEFPAAEVQTRIRHGSLSVPGDPSKHAVLHVCFVGEAVSIASVRTTSGDAAWDDKAVEQAKHLEIKSYELHGGSYLACSNLTFTGKAP
jgi:hypothetical protein